MAQFVILNTSNGEVLGEFTSRYEAEQELDKFLRNNIPYGEEKHYGVFDEKAYNAWLNVEPEDPEPLPPMYQVYAVGRYDDRLKMDKIIVANSRPEAVKKFEKAYPAYRAIDSWPVVM